MLRYALAFTIKASIAYPNTILETQGKYKEIIELLQFHTLQRLRLSLCIKTNNKPLEDLKITSLA